MRGRRALTLALVLAGMLPALRPCAFALDPELDVNQYAHTSWTVREGFAKSGITSIAQTPDGYLWLGTQFGLLRFDGVRNILWQPPPDQHLPSSGVLSLLAATDGTLWIGTWNGLASWKDGRLTQYPELAGHYVFNLLQDHEGVVWVGGMRIGIAIGRLCAIHKSGVHCDGDDGSLGRGVFGLYEDSKSNLWVGVPNGLWRWRPGPAKFYPLPGEPDGLQALSEDIDGKLVIGWNGGIQRFVDGKTYPFQSTVSRFRAHRLLRDRDGGLWIATTDRGILHIHHRRTDVFAQSNGLSGDAVLAVFEDREGSIWVATVNGLDRFRNFAVPTFSMSQGLSSALVQSTMADKDGSVWLSTRGGLNRWNNGQIKTYHLGGGQRNDLPESLFQDSRGRIWLSTNRQFGYLDQGRFNPISTVLGGGVLSITQDRAGNLWVANESRGLFRLSSHGEVRQIPWAELGRKDHASVLAADRERGGLWIGFFLGGIAYFADGQIRVQYTTADGLGEGRVSGFLFDHDGALWISTAGGLSRLKNGRMATLTSKNALPCDTVHWAMDDDNSLWLYAACGLIRINRSELDAWVNNPQRSVQFAVFDSSDGVRSLAASGHYSPQVAKSQDGKIWFLPWDGVSVVDPRNLSFNKLPPPIHIEQITADRKTYAATSRVSLQPLIHDLQIDYTALSLVAPEKVLFRYKLEGVDRDWQEAGNRRQAFYTNLSPGNYTFRVMACNNSGVWNDAGSFLNFSIAPIYYQTIWFRSLCVFVFLAMVAGLYRLRVRQLAGQFNMRLEERVNERTRIARDLHDTLLQSFQGLMLKFRVLALRLQDRPAEAQMLEEVIEQARAAITEGRDAVHGLRSSTLIANDLAQSISVLGEQLRQARRAVAVASKDELNANQADQQSPHFRVHVEGETREIVPLLRDDVYRIAGEALRNAFRHARARQVEVEIHYDQREFRLRVRDDGKGIDRNVLAGDGEGGHYGLPGMHERAKLIGAKLEVWSELDSGTEVELTIPASLAYAESRVKRRFMFWRGTLVFAVVLTSVLLEWCPTASALDPSLDVNQYAHRAWTVREGFFKGQVGSIAQTSDGYIWLGTEYGLVRFDGVKNVNWQPPAGQHLPSNGVMSLLAASDGTLWIGTVNGLANLKNGTLTVYPETIDHFIFAVVEDREGTVWISALSTTLGKLCAIRNSSMSCEGEGTIGRGAFNLYVDSKGTLWAGVKDGLWRWSPGPPRFYPLPGEPNGIQGFGEEQDGTLLVAWKGAVQRFRDGQIEAYPLPGISGPVQVRRIVRDHDGGLWLGTFRHGLLHLHSGRTDAFTQSDGLAGDAVHSIFEDRERNIWVTTVNGADRFRNFAVPTLTTKQGLSHDIVAAVVADKDGSLWFSTYGGLDRWRNGEIETYSLGRSGNINDLPASLFQDRSGRIWVAKASGFGYLEGRRFVPLRSVPERGTVLAIAQDRAGDMWLANEHLGLFQLQSGDVVRQIPWEKLGHKEHASVLAADPRGGLWIGFFYGGIAYLENSQVRGSYTTADGLGGGRISGFHFDSDGALWISTEQGGLSRLKNGRIATLTSKNGLPCDTVNWVTEDDDHAFWLYTACGLVRIYRSELDAWISDPKRTIQTTVFDTSDGVRSHAGGGHYNPVVTTTADGKLWFLPWDGVSVFDPRHLPFNKLPPPVHIEQITADRKTYDATSQMRLPPLVRDLQIDYTALSLVAPEKILFRYKLENWDRDWQDAGNRRQAIYGNLSPGNYTFRVMACNNSGVWNEAGTFLDFSVAPAYYQTIWFRSFCAVAFLGLAVALYRLRVRQLAGQFNLRLEERVNERTRIARDLHDTLLQSFQGLMLKFRVLAFLLPDRPAEARKMLEEVIEQARAAITEGRDAVHGLRSSTVVSNDLAQSVSTLGEQLNASQTGQQSPDFRVHVGGETREIVPLLRDDVYRIAGEALRNAFRHARARHVEVEIRYDQRQFRLRVRDDGKGIDRSVLAGDGKGGHYGLPGMHERAKLIGGKLEVWSELASGTEVELTIPASLAYPESRVKRRFVFW